MGLTAAFIGLDWYASSEVPKALLTSFFVLASFGLNVIGLASYRFKLKVAK